MILHSSADFKSVRFTRRICTTTRMSPFPHQITVARFLKVGVRTEPGHRTLRWRGPGSWSLLPAIQSGWNGKHGAWL
jgi:hypothetical protein